MWICVYTLFKEYFEIIKYTKVEVKVTNKTQITFKYTLTFKDF